MVMYTGHMTKKTSDPRAMNAADFKAKCLAVLDEVAATRRAVVISKRGKPVAKLVPIDPSDGRYPQRRLAGTIEIVGDIVAPAVPAESWDANEKPPV